jgi:colanic acid/amylovoran biosynthesis glycosyltransferase
MRVAHFIETFSARTETFLYDYITEIACQGIDTHVVTLKRLHIEERLFHPVYTIALPNRLHPLRIMSRLAVMTGLTDPDMQYTQLYRNMLYNKLYRIRPQLIHAHFGTAGFLVAPIARKLNIPLIVSFHGYDVYKLPRMERWQNRYKTLFANLSAATCVSEAMRERLIELGVKGDKVQLVHVGKNINKYPYREPTFPIRRFISVGSLIEKKGHFDTVQAFAKATTDSNVTLSIIGEGYLRDKLQSYIDECGMQERVFILGEMPHEQVIEQMIQSDIFILSSKTAVSGDMEGIPTVLMEAQALGLPCISTWHSGIPEVIPEQNRLLLAEEGNIEQLAKCISQVDKMPHKQLQAISQHGRELIEAEFELSSEVAKILDLYRQHCRA